MFDKDVLLVLRKSLEVAYTVQVVSLPKTTIIDIYVILSILK